MEHAAHFQIPYFAVFKQCQRKANGSKKQFKTDQMDLFYRTKVIKKCEKIYNFIVLKEKKKKL